MSPSNLLLKVMFITSRKSLYQITVEYYVYPSEEKQNKTKSIERTRRSRRYTSTKVILTADTLKRVFLEKFITNDINNSQFNSLHKSEF